MFLLNFASKVKLIGMTDLELWWSSLPIAEKERIARKALKKGGINDESLVVYPACTSWWNSLEEERKLKIYTHCVARHGDELRPWDEANPYGD